MPKLGEAKTKCGFRAIVFMVDGSETPIYLGGSIGAILIPNHPAACPGWTAVEWDQSGHCLTNSPLWDLEANSPPAKCERGRHWFDPSKGGQANCRRCGIPETDA
jgi:hypothetical protein